MKRNLPLGLLALCLALMAAGCSRSPRVTFYTLEPSAGAEVSASAALSPSAAQTAPTAPTASAPSAPSAPSVAVGPVTLPDLVDRPQLVVRVAANRVEILESQRWAEPLKSEIPRVVAQELARRLASTRVSSYQQHSGPTADYRVLLDVQRFEAAPGQAVTVEADWTVRRAGGKTRTGHALVREPLKETGYDAVAAGFSRALRAVSGEIAGAIRAEAGAEKP